MKNLFIKLNRTKTSLRYTFFSLLIVFTISIFLITKKLLLLENIETFLRIIYICFSCLLVVVYLISGLVLLILKRHKGFVISSIIIALFCIINIGGSIVIDYYYNILDNIERGQTATLTTNLVALNDTELSDVQKVGMIDLEDDLIGYTLPNMYMEENNTKYEVEMYHEYFDLLEALYNENVDAIWIGSSYTTMFPDHEPFANIESETHILLEFNHEIEDINNHSGRSVTEPFSLLIVGVDAAKDGSLNENGDTLILVTFNPKTLTATLFSIPRDTYVPIACRNNRSNKINSSTVYGTKCIVDTVQQLIGFDIDYNVTINFRGVEDLVNALGGITVTIPKPDFPNGYCVPPERPGMEVVCIEEGEQRLDGKHALAFARVRKAYLISDFQRIKNQQAIIEAIAEEAKNIKSLNEFNAVLNAVSNNISTNMPTSEMLNFYNVGRTILSQSRLSDGQPFSIQRAFLNGYGLEMLLNGAQSYTYQYYEESLNEIVQAMLINLGKRDPEIIKYFEFSANEPYELPVIGSSTKSSEPQKEVLPKFTGKTWSFFESWNQNRNIDFTRVNQVNNCNNGEILEQNITHGTLLENITKLELIVCTSGEIPEHNSSTTTTTEKPTTTTTTKPPIDIDDPINEILN